MALTPVQCATPRPIRLIFEHVDVTWKCSISASHAGRQDVAVAVMCSISTAVRYTSMRYFRRMHLEPIVLAALAVSRWLEQCTGWSIKKFVRTARRYRTVSIRVGDHIIPAADPLPEDLRHAPKTIPPTRLRTNLIRVGLYVG